MLDSAASHEKSLQSNDYHLLPATEKQLNYARSIAQRSGQVLPWEVQQDRQRLSRWIDQQKSAPMPGGPFSNYPSSRQVQFAERIARYKRSQVPDECFRDKGLMSKWIDCNK